MALAPAFAFANNYTFETTGLTSMSHGTAYTWGLSPTANSNGTPLGKLETEMRAGAHIEKATLTILGLYDWVVEPADVLYVNILNNVKAGIKSYTYNSSSPSYDTIFGSDVFNVVEKPTTLVAPLAPGKPTIKLPIAPKPSTLTLPVAPTAPAAFTLVKPVAPTKPTLPSKPTSAQIAAYNAALVVYNTAQAIYTTNLAAYNTAFAANNAAKTKYATDLASYNTKLAAYNAAQTKYATDLATYNTNLAAYNDAQAKYATDKAAYDAALAIYNAALPAYKTNLAAYNKYSKTQVALGYDGVPLVGADGSIYDQAHSLLRADTPNGPGTWTDLDGPKTKTNLVITFSAANKELLQALLASATATTNIGLGFGPECHFYDKNIKLEITSVPETGATLAFFGLGFLCLAGVRRFSKQLR